MAKYERIVTTEAGLALLEKAAYIGGTVEFTALKTGDGVYDGSEDLANVTALKNVRQTIGIESVSKRNSVVVARAVLRNNEMTEGYTMTEIGLFAKDPDTSGEILYAVVLAVTGNEDYVPAFEDTPTSMTFELVMDITDSAEAVTFTALPLEGVYVSVETFNEAIDEVKDDLKNYSKVSAELSLTILASGWTGTEAPYTNTISVTGATGDNNIEVIVPPTATADEITAFVSAMILNGTQANGSITLNCWGTVPEIDLPVTVIVRGD